MVKILGALLICISFAVGTNGFLIACRGQHCEDKCLVSCKPKRTGSCSVTFFTQYTPCSYGCIVNGTYQYYTEPDFSVCGTNKLCYQGECRCQSNTDKCRKRYGPGYIGLEDSVNSCHYNCIPRNGKCGSYLESVQSNVLCIVGYSNKLGVCRDGVCISTSKDSNGGHHFVYDTGVFSISPSPAAAARAATPRGYVSTAQSIAQSEGISAVDVVSSLGDTNVIGNQISGFSNSQGQSYKAQSSFESERNVFGGGKGGSYQEESEYSQFQLGGPDLRKGYSEIAQQKKSQSVGYGAGQADGYSQSQSGSYGVGQAQRYSKSQSGSYGVGQAQRYSKSQSGGSDLHQGYLKVAQQKKSQSVDYSAGQAHAYSQSQAGRYQSGGEQIRSDKSSGQVSGQSRQAYASGQTGAQSGGYSWSAGQSGRSDSNSASQKQGYAAQSQSGGYQSSGVKSQSSKEWEGELDSSDLSFKSESFLNGNGYGSHAKLVDSYQQGGSNKGKSSDNWRLRTAQEEAFEAYQGRKKYGESNYKNEESESSSNESSSQSGQKSSRGYTSGKFGSNYLENIANYVDSSSTDGLVKDAKKEVIGYMDNSRSAVGGAMRSAGSAMSGYSSSGSAMSGYSSSGSSAYSSSGSSSGSSSHSSSSSSSGGKSGLLSIQGGFLPDPGLLELRL